MLIHNFFFIRGFVEELKDKLIGSVLQGAFANKQDELCLDFGSAGHIRLEFLNGFCFYAYFPAPYSPSQNTKPRFRTLWGETLRNISVPDYERAFFLEFKEESILFFMLFGRRSNLLLYEPKQPLPKEVFRYAIQTDKERSLTSFLTPKEIPILPETPLHTLAFVPKEIADLFPGKILHSRADLNNFTEQLNLSWYFTTDLSTFPEPPVLKCKKETQTTDILQTLREYYIHSVSQQKFTSLKNNLLKSKQNELKKKTAALLASKSRLEELQTQRPPKETADLIMAYLHLFDNNVREVWADDFYTGGKTLIKLPKDISPLKYAEKLYKKSGGEKQEKALLQSKIQRLEQQIGELKSEIEALEASTTHRELKAFQRVQNREKKLEQLPYNEYTIDGYIIRIGKNAKANDEMLRKHSHKDDYWLHAKDHAGSHVLIKRNNRQVPVPEHVVLTTASWAAWFSKGKNHDTLPVIITERKYVRKNKNLKPGQVIVDKERVVLVQPKKP